MRIGTCDKCGATNCWVNLVGINPHDEWCGDCYEPRLRSPSCRETKRRDVESLRDSSPSFDNVVRALEDSDDDQAD